MQILPDIYQINGSPFGRWQNSYLINAGGATIVIDSGDMSNIPVVGRDQPAVPGLPEVEENAAIWGFNLDQVSHLFVTHEHFDHASHAAELQRRGIKIVASAKAAEAMVAVDRRVIGWAHARAVEPCRPDIILADGETVDVGSLSVRGITTPGHSEGSMVFDVVVNGARGWFVGDILITTTAHRAVQLPWMGGIDSDKAKYMESMEKLLDFPVRPDNIFPGHGPAGIGLGYQILENAYHAVAVEWRSARDQH